jgi:hypothetical protein
MEEILLKIVGVSVFIIAACIALWLIVTYLYYSYESWIDRSKLIKADDLLRVLGEFDMWCRADLPESEMIVKYIEGNILETNMKRIETFREELRSKRTNGNSAK